MSLSEKTEKKLKEYGSPDLHGKTAIITGANSGVGFKTAETLVFLGAKVILACRNTEKAEAAKASLLKDYPDAEISVMRLDLADFASIRDFVRGIEEGGTDIDVFINNAGVLRHPGEKTKDGYDLVIGTNYIGVYYLSELLFPYLETLDHPVYYVNTVSIAHKIGKIDYNDFYCEKKKSLAVYACSKLCLASYSYETAKRLENSNIRVMMNHPGIAITPLGTNAVGKVVKSLAPAVAWLFNSPEKSSLSAAYILASDPPAGSLIGPTKLFGGWGYPKPNRVSKRIKRGVCGLAGFTDNEIRKSDPEFKR